MTLALTYLFDEEADPYAAIYESGEATPVVFTIITTDRGDVRELLDGDGAAFAFYSYDAFGRPAETTTTPTASLDATTAATIAATNPLRYAGYCYDGFSGLYYCSQRYYDPATAQFITKDPAKADGEESAYQYCGGDPVGGVDPTGEWNTPVHSGKTLYWAEKNVGYPHRVAEAIAYWCDTTDKQHHWLGLPWGPNRKYHMSLSWGWDQVYAARRAGSLHRLGDGLHTLQDCQTHSYYGTGKHHTDIWQDANGTVQSRTKAITLKALKYFAPALRAMQ